jgi:hypothetical protein
MNHYRFFNHLSIFAIIASLFFIGCEPPVAAGVADNYCVDDLYAEQYCEQDMPLEGVYDAEFLRSWVCGEYGCGYSTLPSSSYGHYADFKGYVVFTPDRKNPYEGTLYASLMWVEPDGRSYRLPWFLSSGHYELLPSDGVFRFKYMSHEYGEEQLLVSVFRSGESIELRFAYEDGTPFFDLHMKYRGLFNSCPYAATPYSGEEYGQCFLKDRCRYLASDCITEDDCAWLLEREGRTSGSWAPLGGCCEHVEVPGRPLYQ